MRIVAIGGGNNSNIKKNINYLKDFLQKMKKYLQYLAIGKMENILKSQSKKRD